MAVIQFVFDNFNDNSINTALWTPGVGSTAQSETSGKLNTPAASSSAPTTMTGKNNYYDLTKGRLAVRLTRSGTVDTNVYTFFGIKDDTGNGYLNFHRSSDATISNGINSLGTGTATNVDTTVGMGPSMVANTWFGWTYTVATSTYSLDKSTDGTTWTQVHKFVTTAAGSFNYKKVQLHLGCTSYGTVTNFTPQWDDVTYFATDTLLRGKVRYNGAWLAVYPRVRYASAWYRPITKTRIAGGWGRPQ